MQPAARTETALQMLDKVTATATDTFVSFTLCEQRLTRTQNNPIDLTNDDHRNFRLKSHGRTFCFWSFFPNALFEPSKSVMQERYIINFIYVKCIVTHKIKQLKKQNLQEIQTEKMSKI